MITEKQLASGRRQWSKYGKTKAYKHPQPAPCMLDLPFEEKRIRRAAQSITTQILDHIATYECGLREAITAVLGDI